MKAETMGMSEIPGYVPPWIGGGGGVGGHVNDVPDIGSNGGDDDFFIPAPSQTYAPQTTAQAAPTPVVETAAANNLTVQIDQPTLLVGALVVVGLFFFASR